MHKVIQTSHEDQLPSSELPRFSGRKIVVAQLTIIGAVVLTMCALPDSANAAEDDWDIHVGLPLWAYGIKGTLGIDDNDVERDEDFIDILDDLDFAAGLNLEFRKSRWLFFANSAYAKTSTEGEPGGLLSGLVSEVEVTQKEFDSDFGLGYDVLPGGNFSLEPFVGGRVTYVEAELEVDSPGEPSFSRSTAWADPIFGGIATFRFGPFALFAEADIGGFGVSSDLTWQVHGGVELNILRWPYLRLSYRHQETEFENGSFTFDIQKSGPQLELGLRF
jgi:hypothetical protein